MEIKVQQNIEFPMKDFEKHGKNLLETSYSVSLFICETSDRMFFSGIQKCELELNITSRVPNNSHSWLFCDHT